ncbi:hypothetical protein QZH41_018988 [Actinostola sp. cb2023]|nr:hypothetical protein QZH41_018988 [Actinostola sp. cb2023]
MDDCEPFSHLSLLMNGLDRLAVDGDVIKSAIREIDSRLDENAVSLQENWDELTALCNESLNPDQDLTCQESTKEALALLTSSEFQNHICKPEPMVLNCFLNNVIQALERNPGLEEAIFHDLVKFASAQGMILPYGLPVTTHDHDTRGDADDTDANETTILWNKIRLQIKHGLWFVMSNLKLQTNQSLCAKNHSKQQELIQSLLFLYPHKDVWEGYLQFRTRMVEKYIAAPDLISHVETGIVVQYKDAPTNAVTLAKLSRVLELLITEDMKLIEEGNLPGYTMSFKEIYEVYLEKYMLELRSVLQAYREEKRILSDRRGSSRSTSSMSIHGDDLIVYKLCFLATVSLELTVVKVLEQNSNGITHNVLKPTNNPNTSVGGRTQLPKLAHKSSKELPVLEAWTGTPFSANQSDFPMSLTPSQNVSSPWAWREEFKHVISRISSAVTETIKLGCGSSLEEQSKVYANTNALQVVHLKDELVGGPDDFPKCIAKIIEDFPQKCSVQTLYILLSSAVLVRNRLAQYEEVLGTEPRRPFAVLHRQYSEIVESLTNQIINYQKHVIATVILQDADSHNWEDQRPFYEDERCSFSVQMWNLHIQAIQHDLWKFAPPAKAQFILANLVQHSLSLLTLRYSNAIPSYNRVNQFRCDITTILLATLSFLWPCCDSLNVLFDTSTEETMISSIHNMCSCLLATLAIVTCPLEDLCKCLTSKKKARCRRGSRTGWLSWIHPEVLKTHDGSLGVLIDRQALNVMFKLMINQPLPNWSLVLQSLLLRDARLAMIIVKYGDLSAIGTPESEENTNPHGEHHRWCKESISSPSAQTSTSGLVYSLYHILFQTAQQSSAIVNFLMALVNRYTYLLLPCWTTGSPAISFEAIDKKKKKILTGTQSFARQVERGDWGRQLETLRFQVDHKGFKQGREPDRIDQIFFVFQFPVWLNCLFITFKPYIYRFVKSSLEHLWERDRKRTKSFNFTAMSSLPCGCPCKEPSKKPENTRGEADIIYYALYDLVSQLAENMNTVPSAMFQFVAVLQEMLQRKSIDSSTAGIKVLGWLICRWLSDSECLATDCETAPSPAVLNVVDMFAEVTWHMFVRLGDSTGLIDNTKLPMNLEGRLRSHREWFSTKIQVIMQHIVNHVGEEYQIDTVHDEITDMNCSSFAKELLSDEKGAKALSHVYRFFIDNKDWLMNLILIPGHILPPKPSTNQPQTPALCSFSPLQKYNLIGEFAFDQAKIASFPFEWSSLLQSDLGLLPNAVRKLVCNRFEMQEGAYLEEGEKVQVDKIKAMFGIKDKNSEEDQEQQV